MINKTILSGIILSAFTIGSACAATTSMTPSSLNNTNDNFSYTAPVNVNKNQITLGLGFNGISSKHDSADGGFNLGLEYTRSLTQNIGLFVAASGSLNMAGGLVTSLLTDGEMSTDVDYFTMPIALQFTLPLANNELFARVGANVYSLDEETSTYKNKVYVSQTDHTRNGVGVYAAAGWQYNFGFSASRNWTVGLDYQFYRMKNYKINQYMLNLGYRF